MPLHHFILAILRHPLKQVWVLKLLPSYIFLFLYCFYPAKETADSDFLNILPSPVCISSRWHFLFPLFNKDSSPHVYRNLITYSLLYVFPFRTNHTMTGLQTDIQPRQRGIRMRGYLYFFKPGVLRHRTDPCSNLIHPIKNCAIGVVNYGL